jgi:hypothetical protein
MKPKLFTAPFFTFPYKVSCHTYCTNATLIMVIYYFIFIRVKSIKFSSAFSDRMDCEIALFLLVGPGLN